ncbi:MAG: hypothetical protein B6U69_00115 [Thermofilum sp. ex4484_15]|nr:MAG: hypothetical protein B6U69_00115 [Thermofilum sp. ex4484_15]
MKISGKKLLISLVTVIVASIISYKFPLENYIALIPVSSFYAYSNWNWYPYWRIAFINSFIWLLSAIGYVLGYELAFCFMILSSIPFVIFHYLSLGQVVKYGVKINIAPFLFFEGKYSDMHLDLGQVVAVLTIIASIVEVVKRRHALKVT